MGHCWYYQLPIVSISKSIPAPFPAEIHLHPVWRWISEWTDNSRNDFMWRIQLHQCPHTIISKSQLKSEVASQATGSLLSPGQTLCHIEAPTNGNSAWWKSRITGTQSFLEDSNIINTCTGQKINITFHITTTTWTNTEQTLADFLKDQICSKRHSNNVGSCIWSVSNWSFHRMTIIINHS